MDRNENLEYLRKAQTCIKLNKFISAIGQKNLQPYISKMLNNDVDVSVVSNETLDLIVANIKQELRELQ